MADRGVLPQLLQQLEHGALFRHDSHHQDRWKSSASQSHDTVLSLDLVPQRASSLLLG